MAIFLWCTTYLDKQLVFGLKNYFNFHDCVLILISSDKGRQRKKYMKQTKNFGANLMYYNAAASLLCQ